MKTMYLATLSILLVTFALSCTPKEKPIPAGAKTKEIILNVEGMYCGGCEVSVRKALLKLDGVVKASADHKKGTAHITYIEGKASVAEMVNAINKTGYKASDPLK